MVGYTKEGLMAALHRADKVEDTDAAQAIAIRIVKMRESIPVAHPLHQADWAEPQTPAGKTASEIIPFFAVPERDAATVTP